MENEKPKLANKYFLNMYDIEHFKNKYFKVHHIQKILFVY